MMGPRTSKVEEVSFAGGIDPALTGPAEPNIPVDQVMRAVEGVRPYVKSHLGRYGFMDDVNDVLQEIRVAAWDGTVRGTYHALPGVAFAAWVQGIARNLCSDFLRRAVSKATLPLVDETESGFRCLADVQMSAPFDDRVTTRQWAADVLRFVKDNVPPDTWDLAVASLSGAPDESAGIGADHDARKRWHAVTVVRQMALTVRNAMDVEPQEVVDDDALSAASVESLPNPILRLIADRIVLPDVRGQARIDAVAGVASQIGVSVRYIEVQVGTARNLVRVAQSVLRFGAGIHEPAVAATQPKRVALPR